MVKEETVLFPYIKTLVADQKSGRPAKRPPFGTVRNPIRMMEHEHDRAGEIMREIRTLSRDFTPPEHACATYRVSYLKLEEFEGDLHRHIHLENNILFPGAAALEDGQVGDGSE
jgi:regulator of cell morphogenesis and NO signaling